jgi:hypothetical protein
MRQLKSEAEVARGDYRTLLAAAKGLHAHIGEALASQQAPLQQWYEEVKRAFLFLMDAAEGAKRGAGDASDALRASEVAVEEGRARILMLEDHLSRYEHDASAKANRISELQVAIDHASLTDLAQSLCSTGAARSAGAFGW